MTTREQALIMVRRAKDDLKKETDPDRRNKIAIWGEAMNELAMTLEKQHIVEPDNPINCFCAGCSESLLTSEFPLIKNKYKDKKYVHRSKYCKKCLAERRRESEIRKLFVKK